MRRTLVASLGLGVAVSFACAALPVVTQENFGSLSALIKPRAGEDKWSEIPWLTNLWEARQKAAAEGKPILLWEMDGHPLGCT
jgi:hypothetical protein